MRVVLLLLLAVLGARAEDATVPSPRRAVRPSWQSRLEVHSIAAVARQSGRKGWNEVTQGNKIVLPASVWELLLARQLPYTQFQIVNPECKGRKLFTGPLDFSAAEGKCYLPSWVMAQLNLKEGDTCAVATACYPSATFAKFQPHSSDFLDVPDHYSLLMATLENFAALTAGSMVRASPATSPPRDRHKTAMALAESSIMRAWPSSSTPMPCHRHATAMRPPHDPHATTMALAEGSMVRSGR